MMRMRIALISLIGLCTLLGLRARESVQFPTLGAVQPVELVELWRMGDSEDDDVLFGRIAGMAINGKGQVYVVDWQNDGIYVISGDGAGVNEIGRKGRGPGEFVSLVGVFIGKSDTVFAYDRRTQRMTILDPANHHVVETIQVLDDKVLGYPSQLIGVVPEGFILGYTTMYMYDDLAAEKTLDVKFVDRGGTKVGEPLAKLPVRRSVVYSFPGERGFWYMPFSPRPRATMDANGLLYSGYGDANTIAVRSVDGQMQHTIRWTHNPVPVTSRDLKAVFDGRSRRYRKTMQEADLPKNKPVFQHFVIDDQKRVWVQLSVAYGATETTWVILDMDGNQIDRTELPTTVRLEAVRGYRAYGVLKEDNEADVLVAYAIQ